MPQHVGDDQRILRNAVAFGEIGTTGVAGKHDFVQPGMTHASLYHLMDIANAERPVRHAHRQPVNGDLQHETLRHLFEVQRKIIETETLAQFLELPADFFECLCHFFLPINRPMTIPSARLRGGMLLEKAANRFPDGLIVDQRETAGRCTGFLRSLENSGRFGFESAIRRRRRLDIAEAIRDGCNLRQAVGRPVMIVAKIFAVRRIKQVNVVLGRVVTTVDDILTTVSNAVEATVPPDPRTWKNSASSNSHALTVCATYTISICWY